MDKSAFTATELYAIVLHADKSMVQMNKILASFKMEIGVMWLDEFERRFRTFLNCRSITFTCRIVL